jgi:protein-disulfide isomerase
MRIAPWMVLPIALTVPLTAQNAKKDKETPADEQGITRQQADEILDELRRIRELLEAQAGRGGAQVPVHAKLNLDGFQMLGAANAPITVVEFTDYQCPYCQHFHTEVYGDLKKHYVDTGKVRFFSRDLPLNSLHPDALRAAQAGRCAADQNQFWAMRDMMVSDPTKLDLESLVAYAGKLGVDVDVFRSCLTSEKYKEAVQTDVMDAMRIGAEGTPTFVIGKTTPTGVDGELLVGAQPIGMFVKEFARIEDAK